MSEGMRFSGKVLMIAGLAVALAAVLALVSCCGRRGPDTHDHASAAGDGCCAPGEQVAAHEQAVASTSNESRAPAAEQPQAKVAVAEQTTCPVMGGAINQAIFVEHQGRKVYFCCGGCPEMFKADPAKYAAKLPRS